MDKKNLALSLIFPIFTTIFSLVFSIICLLAADEFLFLFFVPVFLGLFTIYHTKKYGVDTGSVIKIRMCILFAEILLCTIPFLDIGMLSLDFIILAPLLSLVINMIFLIKNRHFLDSEQKRMIILSDPAFHFMIFVAILLLIS